MTDDYLVYRVYRAKWRRWYVEGPVPNLPMAVSEMGPFRSQRKAMDAALDAAELFRQMEGMEDE